MWIPRYIKSKVPPIDVTVNFCDLFRFYPIRSFIHCVKMNLKILLFFVFAIFVLYVTADPVSSSLRSEENLVHTRSKRTLFLKKKVLGAGLLGFGLGVVKGYKYGYHRAPEVHHVYLAPPPSPVKYIEYVEKPVFKEHVESWHPEPPSTYGSW